MGVGGREVVLILESLEHESMRWWEGHVMRKYHADCRPFCFERIFLHQFMVLRVMVWLSLSW